MLTVVAGGVTGERRQAVAALLADAVGSADVAADLIERSMPVTALWSGDVVAAACVWVDAAVGRLAAIAVAEPLRGRGLGRALVDEVTARLGLDVLEAETDADSVGFYRSCGFTVESLGEKYPGVERFLATRRAIPHVRALTAADEEQARAAHDRLATDGVEFCLGLDGMEPWAAWLERTERLRMGGSVPPWVPETFVGAFVGPTLVGRVSVRHRLNEQLALVGGHIGYVVLPEHRRRGYAGVMMREALRIAREVGLDRVLVTCSADNHPSVRVIEAAGGVLQDVVAHPVSGEAKRRYWIVLVA